MTLDDARGPECRLFECIAGSRAYGLATPTSDTDIKGVFITPLRQWLGRDHPVQLNNATNDIVFYELGRYVDLLTKNNPNLIELLFSPEDCLIYRHPLMEKLRPELFLSRRCQHTFAEYATSQITKARGLNKKIVNPQPAQRRGLLDFCYMLEGQGSIPLLTWLQARGLKANDCGLSAVNHVRDLYGLYHDNVATYRGIVTSRESTELCLSSVPREATPLGWMSCNKDAYKKHCKEWAEYQQWLTCRNENRYQQTESHGQGYDAKNLMHTFRLLDAAAEIAQTGRLNVRTRQRDFLLQIKAGAFSYDELLQRAEEQKAQIAEWFSKSDLPEHPDEEAIEEALIEIRRAFYSL
jgi:uncharacterized protein